MHALNQEAQIYKQRVKSNFVNVIPVNYILTTHLYVDRDILSSNVPFICLREWIGSWVVGLDREAFLQ